MPATARPRRLRGGAAGVGAAGLAGLAYASLVERNAYRLRRIRVPVLPPGADPIRVLHLSDLHLTPRNLARQRWVAGLAGLEPDLVVNTGDNLAHPEAVPYVTRCLGRLLDRPGVYVWGSNDYYGPTFKNPLSYLTAPGRQGRENPWPLPWTELDDAFRAAGWADLTHVRTTLQINGVRLGFRGTDDAHLQRDHYATIAGPIERTEVDVAVGVTHAPYRRVLDAMVSDGHDLLLAGHTHGGQVCLPLYGALVSNCDLDPRRAKGLSWYAAAGRAVPLHVSGGLGTSPSAPFRFFCPPEATLLTLTESTGPDAS